MQFIALWDLFPFNGSISYLFSRIGRQIEDQDSQEWYSHAWDDEVDSVEEGLTSHADVKGDVNVRFNTASVELFVTNGRYFEDVPFDRQVELCQIDSEFDDTRVGNLVSMP